MDVLIETWGLEDNLHSPSSLEHFSRTKRVHVLVAYTRLYKSLSRSVSHVVITNSQSVGPLVTRLKFLPENYFYRTIAPAQRRKAHKQINSKFAIFSLSAKI